MTPVSRPAHRPRSMVGLGLIALLASLSWGGAPAQDEDPAAQARWSEVRTALFGDRPVADGSGLIQLTTPYRAADAAAVPVTVTALTDPGAGRVIAELYLIIDMNPVPLAARFHFPGPQALDLIATRVRVNAYSRVRAVAQGADGRLFMVANLVKAAGGCSAPPLADPAAAPVPLGRMSLVLAPRVAPHGRLSADWSIRHPNSSGLQFDQVARQFIPADYVRRIEVGYQDRPLFSVDANISLSEDPGLGFSFTPAADGGDLSVQVEDSTGRRFAQRFPVRSNSGSTPPGPP